MKRRPKWLVILAVLHMLEPLFKIVFFSIVRGISPFELINSQLSTGNVLYNVGFFFLFPIMGIGMLFPNKLVLVLLIAAESLVITSNLSALPHLLRAGDVGQIISLAMFTAINVAVIVLLMTPIFKLAFTDRRMQWWRTFPRYFFEGKIKVNDSISGKIHNISESGIFVSIDGVNLNHEVGMSFTHEDKKYELNGIVRSFIKKGKIKGYGIEFNNNSNDKVSDIRNLIDELKDQGSPRSAEQEMVALFLPFGKWKKVAKLTKDSPTFFYTGEKVEANSSFKQL